MIVISIDPGIVNMGFAVYDMRVDTFKFVSRIELVPNQKSLKNRQQMLQLVWNNLLLKHKEYFDAAHHVVIEKQMNKRETLLEHSIATMLFMLKKDYTVLDPRKIKTMFNTSCNNHSLNKIAAIKTVEALFPDLIASVPTSKKDDVSDAILMCLYYRNTAKGVSTVVNPALGEFNRAKRKRRVAKKRKITTQKRKTVAKRQKK